jgi:hypothetical protein
VLQTNLIRLSPSGIFCKTGAPQALQKFIDGKYLCFFVENIRYFLLAVVATFLSGDTVLDSLALNTLIVRKCGLVRVCFHGEIEWLC